jgi:peptidyl-prolyl cis-trans isomerase SurA
MTTRSLAVLAVVAVLVGGCAVPSWVPFVGKKPEPPLPEVKAAAPATPEPTKAVEPDSPRPGTVVRRRTATPEDVTDRVVAVVNNDAITLGELQQRLAIWAQENKQSVTQANEDELARKILEELIDQRVQLQEADREKIVVEDAEFDEAMAERLKFLRFQTMAELERAARAEGVSIDAFKKRIRDQLRVNKIVRRKVSLRVSVTEQEVDQYLRDNREKLETGLGYHARHILITPDGARDQDWEAARLKAELLRAQLVGGADFAEIARQQSRDLGSARDGGDLGALKRGELAPDIEAEILRLDPAEISKPYRSTLGYHLFRLESKDALEGEGLQRAREQIRDILYRQKYEARLEAWLQEIRQRAVIEVRL